MWREHVPRTVFHAQLVSLTRLIHSSTGHVLCLYSSWSCVVRSVQSTGRASILCDPVCGACLPLFPSFSAVLLVYLCDSIALEAPSRSFFVLPWNYAACLLSNTSC
ncbi:hypothetical protein H4582DRAFT_333451 [Lactarius indigo]|nr:hypothetical protein H4582DRAFT_333451 [Lactarius indigo]